MFVGRVRGFFEFFSEADLSETEFPSALLDELDLETPTAEEWCTMLGNCSPAEDAAAVAFLCETACRSFVLFRGRWISGKCEGFYTPISCPFKKLAWHWVSLRILIALITLFCDPAVAVRASCF